MPDETIPTRVASPPNLHGMSTSTKALSGKKSERVRAKMREIQTAIGSGVQSAREVKMSQAHWSRIMKGESVGYQIAEKVAKYAGIPTEVLLSAASEELEKAVRNERGRWGSPTIAWARKLAETVPEERTQQQWSDLLDEVDKKLEPLIRNLPTKKR